MGQEKMRKNEKMESYNTFSKECLSTGRPGLPRFKREIVLITISMASEDI